MSDSENETNLNDSNIISFDQRMRDFYERQTRNMQQNRRMDNMVDDMIGSNSNLFLQPSNPIPKKKRRYYERNREEGHIRLFKDYFHDNPVYPDHIFRRRFRMRKPLFLRIVEAVTASDTFFQLGPNGSGREGHSALQKCTAAIRVLAYGSACDAVDEYLRMSTAQTSKCITKFVDSVITQFGNQYLRRPNEQDVARLLHVGEERGFLGMMGSIDCMHWQRKNCPTAWQGQYAGRSGKATIILKAVASYDLWIWHAFFGTPGSLNDINVFHRSPVFDDILEGRAPKVNYYVNGNQLI
ncbi:uncharacterized protein LOC141640706 [Silene latifolia]|uniref:uncharacterized protein LOC141640706 n=1 Tax=Silene latifolia TaxID=37657 RepID=UPI003D76DBDE